MRRFHLKRQFAPIKPGHRRAIPWRLRHDRARRRQELRGFITSLQEVACAPF